jgi:hypothetical protein
VEKVKTENMKAIAATALIAMGLMTAGGAEAALASRLGGKAIYDDVADLTWLQDANYAKTSGYDADGLMSRVDASLWAQSLSIDGVTGWRLAAGPVDFGWGDTGSEMGNLFYNALGGVAFSEISSTHNANYDLFSNIQSYSDISNLNPRGYWIGEDADPYGPWLFYFAGGAQLNLDDTLPGFGWAVRSGDVASSPVPVPGALVLLGSAAFGLFGLKRGRGQTGAEKA